jgi:hypothetical protein
MLLKRHSIQRVAALVPVHSEPCLPRQPRHLWQPPESDSSFPTGALTLFLKLFIVKSIPNEGNKGNVKKSVALGCENAAGGLDLTRG